MTRTEYKLRLLIFLSNLISVDFSAFQNSSLLCRAPAKTTWSLPLSNHPSIYSGPGNDLCRRTSQYIPSRRPSEYICRCQVQIFRLEWGNGELQEHVNTLKSQDPSKPIQPHAHQISHTCLFALILSRSWKQDKAHKNLLADKHWGNKQT